MTTLSLDFRQTMADEQTGAVPITLLTFTHPTLGAPIRLSSDRTVRLSADPLTYGTVSRGNSFLWVPMAITWPGDDDQATAEARLVIDALDRQIYGVIRASAEPATALLELVQDSALDTVEMTVGHLTVRSAPYDEAAVQIVMSQEDFWGEQWPRGHMTPAYFPGLHR